MAIKKGLSISQEDNQQIEELHLISGESIGSVSNVLRALFIAFSIAYKENEWLRVPFIGDMLVKHVKDETKPEGTEAEVNIILKPHKNLVRLVGQIEDEEKTGDHTQNDAFQMLLAEVRESLREIVIG